jgi:hypothetical protein
VFLRFKNRVFFKIYLKAIHPNANPNILLLNLKRVKWSWKLIGTK